MSEHRIGYLKDIIDRMIVMEKGRIKQVYTAQEARSLSSEELIGMGLRLLDLPEPGSFLSASDVCSPFLEANNICFKRGKKPVLEDVGLCLERGKISVLSGNNGVGKSTLCRIVSGILEEKSGSVIIDGEKCSAKKRLRESFFVGQDADYQLYTASVLEEICLNLKPSPTKEQVEWVLESLNLEEYAERHPVSLSGGQKQRVLIGAAMLRKRPLLILDEPTSGLDGKHMRIIASVLSQIAKKGTSILLITHDKEFTNLVANEVLNMKDSQTIEKLPLTTKEFPSLFSKTQE